MVLGLWRCCFSTVVRLCLFCCLSLWNATDELKPYARMEHLWMNEEKEVKYAASPLNWNLKLIIALIQPEKRRGKIICVNTQMSDPSTRCHVCGCVAKMNPGNFDPWQELIWIHLTSNVGHSITSHFLMAKSVNCAESSLYSQSPQ